MSQTCDKKVTKSHKSQTFEKSGKLLKNCHKLV